MATGGSDGLDTQLDTGKTPGKGKELAEQAAKHAQNAQTAKNEANAPRNQDDDDDDGDAWGTTFLEGVFDVVSGKAVADVAVDVVGDVIDLAAQGVTTGTGAVTGAVGSIVDTAVDVIDTTSASTNKNVTSALSMFGLGSSTTSTVSGWVWAIAAFVVLGVLALLGWLLFHGETKKRR